MIRDYFILAFRNLRHRGIRSWLTLLGIFIGVMAVVALISLGGGLQRAVAAQFGVSSTEVISVQGGGISASGPPGSGVSKKLTLDDVEAIKKLSSVKTAAGRMIATGKMEYNDVLTFGIAASIPEDDSRDFIYDVMDLEVQTGRLLKKTDTNKVVLGYNFYNDEDTFGKKIEIGKNVLIQDEKFEVVGITKKKGSFIWDNIVLMNDKPLRDLVDYGDDVDIIAVLPRDTSRMEETKEDIEKLMRKRRNVEIGKEDFEVSTPEASLETINSVLGAIKAFVIIIALISVVVGIVGIVNTMTTSVLERKIEIGIMKAIGARNSQVFFQFFIESGLLGFVGGLVGVLAGVGIGFVGVNALNNYLGSEVSMVINWWLIIGTLAGSFIIGASAGIAPAMSAANQDPVEALRG